MSKPNDKLMTISVATGTIFKILIIGVAIAFLWFVKEIVVMLVLAVLLAALIEPSVNWLHRRKIPRSIGVIGIYVILFAAVVVSLILIIPPFIEQLTQLSKNFSDISASITNSVNRLVAIGAQYGFSQGVTTALTSIQTGVNGFISGIFDSISGLVGGIATFVLVLVLAFYIVIEEDVWRRLFRRLAPDEYQPYLAQMFTKMQNKMGAWLRGQLLLMLVIGVVSYIGLLILGVPYALVLALFAGLMEMVPYAGPTISAIPAVLIGFAVSPIKAAMILILYVVIQQMENTFLVPKIMQKVTGLNPVVSIIALLVGFKVGGVPGAMLSIPVATMASVFVYDVFRNKSEESG